MRILRLDLERFGHFKGKSMTFPARGACVVRGANEAGKTTALRAIHSLLFGFHDRAASLAIDFDQKELLVRARVQFENETEIELRRRKGRGATLSGETVAGGDEVTEDWFKQRLHGATRALFENVFAFSIDALARGAETLKHEEIAEALYGAAVGGSASPHRILESLTRERDALFLEKGRRQSINARKHDLDGLRARVRNETLDLDALAASEQAVETARREAHERHAAVARIAAEASRCRALARGVESWRALRAAQDELSTLDVPALSLESVHRHARLVEERARASADLAAQEAEARRIEAELSTIVVDARVLRGEESIASLHAALEMHRAEVHETTEIAARIDSTWRDVARRAQEIAPGWEIDRLRALRFDPAAIAQLDALARRHTELERDTRATTDDIAATDASLREIDAELAALPSVIDDRVAESLARWLDGWSGHVAEVERAEQMATALSKLDRAREATRRRLDPPLSKGADATAIDVPRAELVETRARELDRTQRALDSLVDKLADRRAQLAAIEAELAEIEAAGHVPTEDELRAARDRREAGWRIVLRALQREPTEEEARAFDDARPLPRAFEHAVLAADRVADEMRQRGDRVVQRALCEKKLQRARTELEITANERDAAQRAHEEARARWGAIWARCGFEPLDAGSMRAWLGDHGKLVALDEERAALVAEAERLRARRQAWTHDGRALLALDDAPPDRLRAEATSRIGARNDRLQRHGVLRDRRSRTAIEAGAARERLLRLRDEAARWVDEWRAAVRAIGVLDGDEEAPSVASMRTRVDELRALRDTIVVRDEQQRVVDRLRGSIAAYVARVEEARAAFADDLSSREPTIVVERMHERLRAAMEAQRAHAERTRALEAQRRRLDDAKSAAKQVDSELAEIRARVDAKDDDAFFAVARTVERAAELGATIDRHGRDLRVIGGAWPHDAYLTALATADETVLRADLERLANEERAALEEARACDERIGEAKKTLALITPASTAAEAMAEAESVRAALRVDVERWAMLTVAEELLRAGIRRFEREHQPELLKSASRIFATMTCGRWVGVRKPPHDRGLVVERDDGAELEPDALSTGTREQLYLAVRLAYVETYAKRAEPLPVILDDVLVDFDPSRTVATLRALCELTPQIILFTCHDHVIDLTHKNKLEIAIVDL